MRKSILRLLPFLAIAEAQSESYVSPSLEKMEYPIYKELYSLQTKCNPFASGRRIKHTKMNYRQQQRYKKIKKRIKSTK